MSPVQSQAGRSGTEYTALPVLTQLDAHECALPRVRTVKQDSMRQIQIEHRALLYLLYAVGAVLVAAFLSAGFACCARCCIIAAQARKETHKGMSAPAATRHDGSSTHYTGKLQIASPPGADKHLLVQSAPQKVQGSVNKLVCNSHLP
jgi:hypothetical protein